MITRIFLIFEHSNFKLEPLKNFIFLLLITTLGYSQTNDSLINQIKNNDLKVYFQKYLEQEKQALNFFIENAKPSSNSDFLEISNIDNMVYYDKAIEELKLLSRIKKELFNFYDSKYRKDKELIFIAFDKTDSIINANYISRFKIVKIAFKNVKKPEDVDVLPTDVCQRLASENELLMPTHDACKKLGLAANDEANCAANYLRNQVVQHIQRYLEYYEDSFSMSNSLQFVIDSEGNLIFNRFLMSSGNIEFDLLSYKGFKSFANSTVFCPAKQKGKNVSVIYNLPIKIVISE